MEARASRHEIPPRRDTTDAPPTELSWTPVPGARTFLFQNPASPGLWEGEVTFTLPATADRFRLTLKEHEWFRTDDAASDEATRTTVKVARRVVYADVFAL